MADVVSSPVSAVADNRNIAIATRTHELLKLDGLRDESVCHRLQSGALNTEVLDALASSGEWDSPSAATNRIAALTNQTIDSINGSKGVLDRAEARLAYRKALDGLLASLVTGDRRKLNISAEQFRKYQKDVLGAKTEGEQLTVLRRVLNELPSEVARSLYGSIERVESSQRVSPKLPISVARQDFDSYQSQQTSPTVIQQRVMGNDSDKVALNEAIRFRMLGKYGEAKSILFGILGDEARQALSSISEEDKEALRQKATKEMERAGGVEPLREFLTYRRSAMVKVLSARASRSGYVLSEDGAGKIVDKQIETQLKSASESFYNRALEQEVIKRLSSFHRSGVKGEAISELHDKYLDGRPFHFSAEERDAFYDTVLNGSLVAFAGGIGGTVAGVVKAGALRVTGVRVLAQAAGFAANGIAFESSLSILKTPIEGSQAWSDMPERIATSIGMFATLRGGQVFWNSTGRKLLTETCGIDSSLLRNGMPVSTLLGNRVLFDKVGSFATEVSAFTAYGFGVQELRALVNGRSFGEDVLGRLETQSDESLKTLIGLKIGGSAVLPMLRISLAKMGQAGAALRIRLDDIWQRASATNPKLLTGDTQWQPQQVQQQQARLSEQDILERQRLQDMQRQNYMSAEPSPQIERSVDRAFKVLDRTGFLELRQSEPQFSAWIQGLSYEDFVRHMTRMNGILREVPIKQRSVDGQNVNITMGPNANITYMPPPAAQKELVMRRMFDALKKIPENEDRALLLYYALQATHLYSDGNGRVGRLVHELVSIEDKGLTREKFSDLLSHDQAGHAGVGAGRNAFAKTVLEPQKAHYLINREVARDIFGNDFMSEYGGVLYGAPVGAGYVPDIANISASEKELVARIIGERDVKLFSFGGMAILKLLQENGKLSQCQYAIRPTVSEREGVWEDVGKKKLGINAEAFEASLTTEDVRRLIEIHDEIKQRFFKTMIDVFEHPDNHQAKTKQGDSVPIKTLFRL